eukprot:1158439-Pelagomonas_calceolata.AAC.10
MEECRSYEHWLNSLHFATFPSIAIGPIIALGICLTAPPISQTCAHLQPPPPRNNLASPTLK